MFVMSNITTVSIAFVTAGFMAACSNNSEPVAVTTPLPVVDEIFVDICGGITDFSATVEKATASKWKPASEDLDVGLKAMMLVSRNQDRAKGYETEYQIFQRSPKNGFIFLILSKSNSNPKGQELGCHMYDFNVYERALNVDAEGIIENWVGNAPDNVQSSNEHLNMKMWENPSSKPGLSLVTVGSMSDHPKLRQQSGFSAHAWSVSILAKE